MHKDCVMEDQAKSVSLSSTTDRFSFDLCPSCTFFAGSEEGRRHCTECGADLMRECPRCAAPIDNPYAQHCGNCGRAYRGAGHRGRQAS